MGQKKDVTRTRELLRPILPGKCGQISPAELVPQVGDLKTSIRALQAESEEVKLNQEELNANMVSLSDQVYPHCSAPA